HAHTHTHTHSLCIDPVSCGVTGIWSTPPPTFPSVVELPLCGLSWKGKLPSNPLVAVITAAGSGPPGATQKHAAEITETKSTADTHDIFTVHFRRSDLFPPPQLHSNVGPGVCCRVTLPFSKPLTRMAEVSTQRQCHNNLNTGSETRRTPLQYFPGIIFFNLDSMNISKLGIYICECRILITALKTPH
uniref:Uncharacterized protein n=1 Tax=Gasterosteus aculeatus TaxID=69293 RepID=G3PB44_GASAC